MGDRGVGSPNCLLLDHWALMLTPVFDETPYLVGSATVNPTWRDVDVRVILDDAVFDAWFGDSLAASNVHGAKWSALMAAISLWGQKVTGLPIDFQVQRRSRVSSADWDKPRHPLGIFAVDGQIPVVVPSWRAAITAKPDEAKPSDNVSKHKRMADGWCITHHADCAGSLHPEGDGKRGSSVRDEGSRPAASSELRSGGSA